MTPLATPAIVLSLLLVGLYASAWTAWRGRTWSDWPYYLLAALVGFSFGEWLGITGDWRPTAIGQVYVLPATLSSAAALWIAGVIRHRFRR